MTSRIPAGYLNGRRRRFDGPQIVGDSVYHERMQKVEVSTPVSVSNSPGPGAAGQRRLVILGVTAEGRSFRPSDWAERLAGAMSAFRPRRAGAQDHLSYSPYVLPSERDGIKCVIVDPRLQQIEPMAWKFVVSFAADNDLVTQDL